MEPARHTVAAARAGDPSAFESLFARNIPKLVAFVRARSGGIVAGRESAHDIAQSVCREALEDLEEFEFQGEDAFRRWLFVRAIHKLAHRHRWHRRDKRDAGREVAAALDEDDATTLLGAFATLQTPSRHASAREELARLESCLGTLPDAQRDAIAMTRIAGLSYREAAELVGRSESAVRGLVMRGLGRLSGLLDRSAGAC